MFFLNKHVVLARAKVILPILNSKTFLMKISCSFRLFWDAMLFNSSEKIKSEEELISS